MSRSSLYQRKDIPRYRRPGSRVMMFDQDELETWLKQGRISDQSEPTFESPDTAELHQITEQVTEGVAGVVDISPQRIYHRNAQYR